MKLLLALALLLHHPAFLVTASASSSNSASCPHDNATSSTTHLDFSLSSDPKKAITVDFEGRSLVSGNATIKFQLLSQNEEVYSSEFDPCDAGIAAFCPLAEGPFNVTMNRRVPEMFAFSLTEADVGRISLEISTAAGKVLQTCAQADLASDAANDEGGASTLSSDSDSNNNSGNATEPEDGSSDGSTNTTASNDSNESSDSGASSLQQASRLLFYPTLFAIIWQAYHI